MLYYLDRLSLAGLHRFLKLLELPVNRILNNDHLVADLLLQLLNIVRQSVILEILKLPDKRLNLPIIVVLTAGFASCTRLRTLIAFVR